MSAINTLPYGTVDDEEVAPIHNTASCEYKDDCVDLLKTISVNNIFLSSTRAVSVLNSFVLFSKHSFEFIFYYEIICSFDLKVDE